jgi:hypothetical protein
MPFAQEPECEHETAMFSGRAVYVLGLLHLPSAELSFIVKKKSLSRPLLSPTDLVRYRIIRRNTLISHEKIEGSRA